MALCICLAMIASSSFAEENKEKKALSDEGEVSYVKTDGNTQVTTLSAKNLLKYQFNEKLLGSWKVGWVMRKRHDVKTAKTTLPDLKLDYQYTERLYSFVNAGWLQNRFAGVDEIVYGGVGAGYKFLDGPARFLMGGTGCNVCSRQVY